ncbi:MAG: GntR family transcriptional regulator, partial [Phaeodactylibacter sp.]|nr:GntR family transcriptional regulator [Phaeodactylibacter sp.]
MSFIKINEFSKTPKYKQLINSIISAVGNGSLKEGDQLPSVNKLLIQFDISRDTVVKAYDHLKMIGLINSMPGKGYYVKSTNFRQQAKVFLLFNKLSVHKKIIYDSFSQMLGDRASIDFFIYNNDFQLFKKIITSQKDESYTHFVILPHFLEGGENSCEFINQLPKHKLIILDKKLDCINGEYSTIYQDFEEDIYNVLTEALPLLQKYAKLNIIFPPYSYHPKEILTGFRKFCAEYAFDHAIVNDIATEPIGKNEVFINLMEDDLVTLIKRIKHLGLRVGKNVGIISYNETPLKEILLDGITITGGHADLNDANNNHRGGGILSREALTLRNVIVTGNYALGYGGGASLFVGNCILDQCLFSSNESAGGGGGGAIRLNTSDLTAVDTHFTLNTASNATGDGGAIHCPSNSSLTLTRCEFTANTARYGGGIYKIGSGTLLNCLFSENQAQFGGGIYNGSNLNLTNCAFRANTATSDGAAEQSEVTELLKQIDAIGQSTKFAGRAVFGASAVTFQVGALSSDTISVTTSTLSSASMGASGASTNLSTINLESGASAAIGSIRDAIDDINSLRANLGAQQNRLEHTITNHNVTTENLQASESRIRDLDIAAEMVSFTRHQIMV